MPLQQTPRSSLNSALLIDLSARMSFYTDTIVGMQTNDPMVHFNLGISSYFNEKKN